MKMILIIGIVLIMGGILFPLIKYMLETRKENNKVSKGLKSKGIKGNNNSSERTVTTDFDSKVEKGITINDSRDLLDFEDILICNEDEAILRVSEDEYLAFLEIGGVPYNLLSVDEKISLEENYGGLLNGVDFEFQNYIQSRSLNLDSFINKYQLRVDELSKKVSIIKQKIDSSESDIEKKKLNIDLGKMQNQLKYGYQLLDDFKSKYIDSPLLERKYYIILKYYHDSSEFNNLSDIEVLKVAYNDLYNKAALFMDSFERQGMSCDFLDAMGIAELQYSSFNKEESNYLKLENAVKAKYNHLCTTAQPVIIKKIREEKNKLQKEKKDIEEEIKSNIDELNNLNDMEV